MKRFVEGANRGQAMLFPERLDDALRDDNAVRVVDAYIDALDLAELGFDVVPAATGRPGYPPATLLKIYLYGYLNQIQSSRKLERECGRNVELIWLTGRLMSDFKTIADFRKDNGPAIRKVCRQFVALCRSMHLLDHASVAIDGSKFKAVNAREKNFTHDRLKRRMAAADKTITRYLSELDRADRQQAATGVPVPDAKMTRLTERIDALESEIKRLSALETKLVNAGDKQISLTDPDARAMTSQSHSVYVVGYNMQSAVDTEHHLIVTHEVSNIGTDRGQLSRMADQARDALQADEMEVIADRGYDKSEEIAKCEEADISVYVPKPATSNARAHGRFDRREFVYDEGKDLYVCPAGQHLTRRFTTVEQGKTMRWYWTTACKSCPIKEQCTTGSEQRIRRWEHEAVLERVQQRLDENPDKMRIRKTVEHPFGTIKAWMGATHFKMKTLRHVATEMALHVLAYNMRRAMTIIGVTGLIEAIAA